MALLPLGGAMLFLLLGSALGAVAAEAPGESAELRGELEKLRVKFGMPAMGAGVMRDGQLVELAATGFRKQGSEVPVERDDAWHLGSCTKAMTATLAATCVQAGEVRWETTVGEVFPEWRAELAPGWAGVTLQQLLTHTAGAPGDAPAELWEQAWRTTGTPEAQRARFVHGLLTRPPETVPGAQYVYSNQGYAIAGHMLEHRLGRSWETLLQERLFTPLHLAAGFGAPGTPGQLDAPWGHHGNGKKLMPEKPGPNGDNPAAIGPAATVHASLESWLRFCSLHAIGEREGGLGLPPALFRHLHQPAAVGKQDYALGWIVTRRSWAGGRVLTHSGSNTMWYATTWVLPEKGIALCATANAGNGFAACDAAIALLVARLGLE